jgi:hypothetical protein
MGMLPTNWAAMLIYEIASMRAISRIEQLSNDLDFDDGDGNEMLDGNEILDDEIFTGTDTKDDGVVDLDSILGDLDIAIDEDDSNDGSNIIADNDEDDDPFDFIINGDSNDGSNIIADNDEDDDPLDFIINGDSNDVSTNDVSNIIADNDEDDDPFDFIING